MAHIKTSKTWYRLGVAAIALCFTAAALSSGTASSQQAPAIKPAPQTAPAFQTAPAPPFAAEPATPSKPGEQGITVHGRWVIDIRNPDGTLAQHHEFENSLSATGGYLLVGLLSGQLSPGSFLVALGAPTGGTGPCQGPQYQFCGLVQSTTTTPGSIYCGLYLCSANLTVTPAYGTNFVGPFTLTLAGSITANQAGAIGFVQTAAAACGSAPPGSGNPSAPTTVLPATCAAETNGNNYFSLPFTQTSPTPINVTSGQLIQVQVVISFS